MGCPVVRDMTCPRCRKEGLEDKTCTSYRRMMYRHEYGYRFKMKCSCGKKFYWWCHVPTFEELEQIVAAHRRFNPNKYPPVSDYT